MLRSLMSASHGYMFLASGESWFYQDGTESAVIGKLKRGCEFKGTICSVAFQRGQIDDYQRMLSDARATLPLRINEQVARLIA